MCKTRGYLGFNVGLYGLPSLAFIGGCCRKDLTKVARGDMGYHPPVLDVLIIVNDWRNNISIYLVGA